MDTHWQKVERRSGDPRVPELCVSETCSIQWGQLKACWPPLVTQQQLRMQAVLAAVLQKQISPGACLQRLPHSPPERAHSAYDSPIAQLNGLIQDYPELSCLPISSFSNFDQQINPGSTSFFFLDLVLQISIVSLDILCITVEKNIWEFLILLTLSLFSENYLSSEVKGN